MKTTSSDVGWKERLREYLASRKGRVTRQRMRVAEVFFEMGGHRSAEDLVKEVRKRYPSIGPATIYRTLKLLCDCGIAEMREFGEGFARYEVLLPDEHHDHLICTSCGRIIEFEEEAIEALQERVAMRYGFQMHHHRLEIYGLCRECARRSQNSSTTAVSKEK